MNRLPAIQTEMYFTLTHIWFISLIPTMCAILLCSCMAAMGQSNVKLSDSTIAMQKGKIGASLDTSKHLVDSTLRDANRVFQLKRKQMIEQIEKQRASMTAKLTSKPKINKDSIQKSLLANPYKNLLPISKPWFQWGGGYIAYNLNYRSNTDTPFAENNLVQHMLTGSVRFMLAKSLPFVANMWIRRTNSPYFSNITDIQIQFNAAQYRINAMDTMRKRFITLANALGDTALNRALVLKGGQVSSLENWLKNPFQFQRLVEANEIYRIPEKSYNPALPDSTNKKNSDSTRKVAKDFIDLYYRQQALLSKLKREQDSLEVKYKSWAKRVDNLKLILAARSRDPDLAKSWQDSLRALAGKEFTIPAKYRWLLGLRNFSVGKSPVNYSELTAKNISLNGINLEYNSWYYLAISAGLVDYRFHDFLVNGVSKIPQYLYLARLGVGKLQGNHLIATIYKGQKQLFVTVDSLGQTTKITIVGMALEAQWLPQRNVRVTAEVAQSLSPDYRFNPPSSGKFNFQDYSNKAVSVRFTSYQPALGLRIDAQYRYSGANFQSFSTFQTNAAFKSWYVQATESLLKNRLRLSASVKTNDYSNPYVIQNYSTNMLFTTVSATYKAKHFPTVSVAYTPMSQYTVLGSQIVENRFQTMTGSITHSYKLANIRATSFLVYSQFYNRSSDTGFVFYNAKYWLLGEGLYFRDFTSNTSFTRTVNSKYILNVAGEDVSFNLSKRMSLGLGVKINNFNRNENQVGENIHMNLRVGRADLISFNFERGYLPGSAGNLVLNDYGNIQLMKRIP